jgi:hypothetical protein
MAVMGCRRALMRSRWLLALALPCALAGSVSAQQGGVDPRTPAGQLAVCGGAAKWQHIAYLAFQVRIDSPQGEQGPWTYKWDRKDGYLRMMGKGPNGGNIDTAIELGSRTGGGWRNGKQLTGKPLADLVSWSLKRFSEDVLWLTFPLEWGAPGVTVTPLPDVAGGNAVVHPVVEVHSSNGTWQAWLDPATGRIEKTVFQRGGTGRVTVDWSDWSEHAGVFFASLHAVEESGEKVVTSVQDALPTVPAGVF